MTDPAPDDLTVTWAMEGGATGTATIAKGATSVDVPASVTDNALDEPDRTVSFRIVSIDHGVQVTRDTAVGTIVDDDPPPAVSITGTTVNEGDTSLTDAVATVSLSAPSAYDVTVQYATADGTAAAPGDYSPASGEVTIPAGATEAKVHVAVHGDTQMEPDETLRLTLADPVNATLGTAGATITIHDDEPLVVNTKSPTVAEGDTGTTPATFDVSITAPPAGETVQVPWSIAAGTAEIPGDVEGANGTLSFDAATTDGSVTAQVVGDTVAEDLPVETFRLAFGDAVDSAGRTVLFGDRQPARVNDDDVASPPADPVTADPGGDVSGVEGSAIALSGSASGGSARSPPPGRSTTRTARSRIRPRWQRRSVAPTTRARSSR